MTLSRTYLCIGAALAIFAARTGQATGGQTGRAAPVGYTNHAYTSALAAFANYQSCGTRARAREVDRLGTALRAAEGAARAKGLGPELDRVKRDYLALLAVSTMTACARGPVTALNGARGAIRAFGTWVAER
jgi:hypothetical protein